jgi:hypothetical protein
MKFKKQKMTALTMVGLLGPGTIASAKIHYQETFNVAAVMFYYS